MPRATQSSKVMTVAVLTGIVWAVAELLLRGAPVAGHGAPVLACSVLVAVALSIPAALAAVALPRVISFAARLVACQVAAIGTCVLAVSGYLRFSGAAPMASAATVLIVGAAMLAAAVPAAIAGLAAHRLARLVPARLSIPARALALLMLAWSSWWLATCREAPIPERWASLAEASAREPSVVLLIGDTLRADHVSALGYARATTPNLARLGGTLFTHARSVSNWTRPAVTTMLSGLPPLTHGVLNVTSALPDGMATLPEIFAGAGFATAFLTANPNTGAVFGFDRGCDVFFDAAAHPLSRLLPTTLGQVAARLLLRFDRASSLGGEVMRFLDAVGSRRFFLVVHYNDPHTPYAPPDPFDRLFVQSRPGRASHDPVHIRPQNEPERQAAIALYDGEIASLDHALAAVIDQLRTRGLLDRTAMVFAADHGEEFDEHGGYGHGRTLFEEILRVPLLVRPPGNVVPASVEAAPVTLLDVAPTLLALGGVKVPGEWPGTDVRVRGGDGVRAKLATSEIPHAAAWIDGSLKLVLDLDHQRETLFDLQADPGEQHEAAGQQQAVVAQLRTNLQHALEAAGARRMKPVDLALSRELIDELRRLGYAK